MTKIKIKTKHNTIERYLPTYPYNIHALQSLQLTIHNQLLTITAFLDYLINKNHLSVRNILSKTADVTTHKTPITCAKKEMSYIYGERYLHACLRTVPYQVPVPLARIRNTYSMVLYFVPCRRELAGRSLARELIRSEFC